MRMSPQRREAINEYERVRRNAMRKVRRLEKKGILTGYIKPREIEYRPDYDNLKSIRQSIQNLKEFNKRSNAYYKGRNGSPLPADLVREYKKERRRAEKSSRKWWSNYATEPVITPSGYSTDYNALDRFRYTKRGGPYARQRESFEKPLESMNRSEMKSAIKRFKQMNNPEYFEERRQNLRSGLMNAVQFVDKDLARTLYELPDEIIDQLYDFSDAFNQLAEYYKILNFTKPDEMDYDDYIEEAYDDYDLEMQNQIKDMRNRIKRLIDTAETKAASSPKAKKSTTKTNGKPAKLSKGVKAIGEALGAVIKAVK